MRVGTSKSRRRKDGESPAHGKTRSFDRNLTLGESQYTHLKNSSSFDSTTNRTTKSTHDVDSIDAVHSRIKYGGYNNITSSTENISSASALKSSTRSKELLSDSYVTNSNSISNPSAKTSSSPFLQSLNKTSASNNYSSSKSYNTTVNHQVEDRRFASSSLSASKTVNGNGIRGSPHTFGDLVVDGDGLGMVLVNSSATVSITSEFGQTALDNVSVDVQGKYLFSEITCCVTQPYILRNLGKVSSMYCF